MRIGLIIQAFRSTLCIYIYIYTLTAVYDIENTLDGSIYRRLTLIPNFVSLLLLVKEH